MAQKVKIAELFGDGQKLAHTRKRATYWELAYFWGQTALFDDLAPTKWDEVFWAGVNNEHPKMYEGFDWDGSKHERG